MRLSYIIIFIGASLAALAMGTSTYLLHHYWIDLSALAYYNPGKPSVVLDDEQKEIMRFQLDYREPVALIDMPDHLIKAFLAAEDRQFFSHSGISWTGIIRSCIVNISSRRIVQGASTITQQLVKLLFCTNERTFVRKVKEQIIAFIVEQQFTKEHILETYLNHIYLGSGIYGVQAASKRFWNKDVSELNLGEAALLAGIVRSPAAYCPLLTLEGAQKRRNSVLQRMYSCRFITEETYKAAQDEPLMLVEKRKQSVCAPHACEMIRKTLEDRVGRTALYTGGLTIQTTLNQEMQLHAEKIFKKRIESLRQSVPAIDGTVVTLRPQNAAIKALVGGYDFKLSQFNRATQAQRQMGSIFKPFVYAASLEHKYHLSHIIIDEPITQFTNWNPNNVHKRFEGPMTLARALIHSNNIIPIKLLLEIGVPAIRDFSQRCGLPGPFPNYPSLALGCTECTALQAARAYNTFINNGVCTEPYLIEWIKDQWGKKIWRHIPQHHTVCSWGISSRILHLLTQVADHIKQRMPQRWVQCESMGKTGTTNDARTCWFVGATPSWTTAVYLGCDDNQSMGKNIYATHHAAPLWADINNGYPQPVEQFFYHPNLKIKGIHGRTGEPRNPASPGTVLLLD